MMCAVHPTIRAATLRNSPQVLSGFGELTGNDAIDLALRVTTLVVYAAIGFSIAGNPRHQGFHDRLAGGTIVVRPGEREFEDLR